MTRLSIAIEHGLPDFTLAVEIERDARILAVTGTSGSGKTTLLDVVAGLARPGRGRVCVGGALFLDTARGIDHPVHRRGIGYVFQDGRLFPHMTVGQNLRYGRWFARAVPAPDHDREIVDLLGIAPLLARRIGGLSGGERQRVAIGRALLSRPRLLLMDEPFAALDDARRRDLMPLVESIRDRTGIPIIYVSHNAGEVERLADAVVLLREGRVVG